MRPCLASRGPDGEGVWARGPVALGHRRLKIIDLSDGRRPADGRRRARPDRWSSTAASTTTGSCATSCEGHGYRFFSTSDTEVIIKAYHRWGADCVEHFLGMFAFAIVEHDTGTRGAGPRPARHQAALPGRDARTGCASPPPCPPCSPAGDVDTSIDPVALHHYMTFHSVVPAPRTILDRRPQAAAGHGPGDRAGRPAHRPRLLGAGVHPRPRPADWTARGLGSTRCSSGCGPRSSGGWSPTCRSACCSPAASTPA